MAFPVTSDTFNFSGDGLTDSNTGAANKAGTVGGDFIVYGSDSGLVLDTSSTGGWTLTINGGVFGEGFYGINLKGNNASALSSVNVGATGDLWGEASAITATHATSVTNAAVIGSNTGSAIFESISGHNKALTISNAATGTIFSNGGYGIEIVGSAFNAAASRTITNAGTIIGDSAFGAIDTDGSGTWVATDKVTNSGTLGDADNSYTLVDPGSGAVFLGEGDDSFANTGYVYGLVDLGDGKNTLSNTKLIDGSITATDGDDTVTNTGGTINGDVTLGKGTNSLTSSGVAALIDGDITGGVGNDKITNTAGTITGDLSLSDGVNSVTNTGKLGDGAGDAITGGANNDTITNTGGTISGNLSLSDGVNVVTNTGKIGLGAGIAIQGGANNDTITNTGAAAAILGNIVVSGGTNVVTNSGTLGLAGSIAILGGDGNDTITNTGGTIAGDVTLEGGATTGINSVTNSGTIGDGTGLAITGGGSNDTIINSGTINEGLSLGAGNDTVNNTGTIKGAIDLGSAGIYGVDLATVVNVLTNTKTISGGVTGGIGADRITNSGTIGSNVVLGDGNNEFKGAAGQVSGFVTGGAGNDIYDSGATVTKYVDLGEGADNKFSNKGRIEGENGGYGVKIGGAGTAATDTYTFTNSGTILKSVQVNALATSGTLLAPNIFTNSGTIGVDGKFVTVELSAGIDKVTNTGTVYGAFFLGAGADTFIGGASNEVVVDSDGGDAITLNGNKATGAFDSDPGNVYFAGGGAVGGADTINGGTGAADLYIAGTYDNLTGKLDDVSLVDVFINLDTADHKDDSLGALSSGVSIVKNTAFGVEISGKATSDPGTNDTVIGFDWAIGGHGNDVIFGSATANQLFGDHPDGTGLSGNDALYGYAGNDLIFGGGGEDILVGGLGLDKLSGGSGSDVFVYDVVADSTLAVAGRDLIFDFDPTSDVLDFSSFKLLVTSLTNLNVEFTGMNTAWTSATVEARGVFTATGTQLQIDTNGDNKADFAIDFADRISLTKGNFLIAGTEFGTANSDSKDFSAEITDKTYYAAGGDDTITGGDGNDTLVGGSGADNISGGDGKDTLAGGADSDVISGGDGDDTLIGGGGDDDITGGGGSGNTGDTVVYSQAYSKTLYTVALGTVSDITVDSLDPSSDEGTDTVSGVERIQFGSDIYVLNLGKDGVGDILNGTAPSLLTSGRDFIIGGTGDDTVTGDAGNDVLLGGGGIDTLDFTGQLSAQGVTVNLATEKATGSGIGTDIIESFENVLGGAGADTITGSTGANVLKGNGGVDTIDGGDGADTITGGEGADIIKLGTKVGDIDTVVFGATTEYGDTVSEFQVATDLIQFTSGLLSNFDDKGASNGIVASTSSSGTDGVADAIDLALFEVVFLTGMNGEGVAGAQLANLSAVATEINQEFTLTSSASSADAGYDALFVVNATDGSNKFGVYQFLETVANSTVTAAELKLVGVFNADGTATDANILFA